MSRYQSSTCRLFHSHSPATMELLSPIRDCIWGITGVDDHWPKVPTRRCPTSMTTEESSDRYAGVRPCNELIYNRFTWMHNGISCRLSGTVSSLMTQLGSRPVVPNRGEISPLGEILVFLGGNSGRAGNINNAVNIAIINIHVSLIFLNNSWNHSTDKYKSQFVASYVYLSTKYRIILMK